MKKTEALDEDILHVLEYKLFEAVSLEEDPDILMEHYLIDYMQEVV